MAIKVNLVPADILAKVAQKEQMVQVGIVAVLVFMLIGLVSFGHWYRLSRLEGQLAEGMVKLKKLEVVVQKVEELERTAAAVRARLNVITDLLKGRPVYPRFMDEFARSVPLGIKVKTLTTTGGGSAAAPLKLTMDATSRSNEDIAAWIKTLESTGRFSKVELGPVNAAGATGEKTYDFSLTSTYTPQL